jgi:UTP--glucose-1-phosphate uridylyltransferase
MNVDVAVIPAAGRGTRMRPATRSVPKALLPVVDRPAIQWIVEEGLRAGVHEFVIVVNPGVDDLLYSHFEGMEGLDELEGFDGVVLRWVIQEEALGLGHAVLQARDAVGDRPFFCLLGDNLVVPGADSLQPMADATDGRSVICLRELDSSGLDKYGVAVPGEWRDERALEVLGAIEKPGKKKAPSRLGLVGRYLFTAEIFEYLASLEPGFGGELQLTDAIAGLAEAGRCLGWVADRDLLDVGNPPGYVQATAVLGLWHEAVRPGFREFLEDLLEES